MALHCPACGGMVRAEHVDVALNDATCPHCQEPFRPSCVLAKQAASRPVPGVLNVEHLPKGGIRVHIPPAGLSRKTLNVLGFALLWNLGIIPIFVGLLICIVKGDVPWAVILLFVPLFLIGAVSAYVACRLAWSQTTLWLDRDGFAIVRELFGHQRSQAFPLDEVEGFSREFSYTQDTRPVFACQARVGRKTINFGHRFSEQDQNWLVDELNRVLSDLRQ